MKGRPMIIRLIVSLFILLSASDAFCGYRTTFNPFTGKQDKVGVSTVADIGVDCDANQIIKRNAGDTAWECATDGGGSGSPGGSNGAVQFNQAGSFSGEASDFSYNSTTDSLTIRGDLTLSGGDLVFNTNTDRFTLMADGTNFSAEAIDLGTDTTGNYAAGDAEGGAATSGDSATAFFSSGSIERARGGLAADTSAFGAGIIGSDGSNNTIDIDTIAEIETAIGSTNIIVSTEIDQIAEVNTLIGDAGDLYYAGGADIALADGGLANSLADPNADQILFWDDSYGAITFLAVGSGLSISGTTITSSGGSGDITDVGDCSSGSCFSGGADGGNSLQFEGSSVDTAEITLTAADPSIDYTITLPATTGNVVTTGDSGTVTATMVLNDTLTPTDFATTLTFGSSDVIDASSATSLSVPASTNNTLSSNGQIAVDTTDNQVLYYSGAVKVLRDKEVKCVKIEDLAATDDNFDIFFELDPITVTDVGCRYSGTGTTVGTIALEDASGNAMTHSTPMCVTTTTSATWQSVTAANSLTAGEGLRMDVTNTPVPSTDDYVICWAYTYDRQ